MFNEGIIKFKQDLTRDDTILDGSDVENLNRLRNELYNLGLVGVYPPDHPEFAGIGYGNVSQRAGKGTGFLITGSATGKKRTLGPTDYALVQFADLKGNFVQAVGGTKASSESLTHAAIYQTSAPEDVKFIAHVHHKGLWESWEKLGFNTTKEGVEYGTSEMGIEVQRVFKEKQVPGTIIAMLGHRDGLVSWGPGIDVVIEAFKKTLELL